MKTSTSRRRILAATAFLASPRLVYGQKYSQNAPTPFTPKLGQFGKDVVWIPTPDALVTRLLRMAQLRPAETLVDLGSGDGKIVIAAARDFGARARGVEYDARLTALARQRAQTAGVAALTQFVEGDLFDADISDADVIALYLLPAINLRLRPQLLRLKPGTRIVTHQFTMGDWQPDEASVVEHRTGFLWVVPANAGGVWTVDLPQQGGGAATVQMAISQTFQRVEGVATLGLADGKPLQTTLRAPQLSGQHIAFAFTDTAGVLRHVTAEIDGDRMRGTVTGAGLGKQPFTARRVGAAPEIGGSGTATLEEERAAGALLGDF